MTMRIMPGDMVTCHSKKVKCSVWSTPDRFDPGTVGQMQGSVVGLVLDYRDGYALLLLDRCVGWVSFDHLKLVNR